MWGLFYDYCRKALKGCGEGGDVYAFIQKIEHISFVEAVELLADRIGYTVTYTGAAATISPGPPWPGARTTAPASAAISAPAAQSQTCTPSS